MWRMTTTHEWTHIPRSQYDALKAEHERLLVELTHRVGWEERCLRAEAEIERLRAENAQLRASLTPRYSTQ